MATAAVFRSKISLWVDHFPA